MQNRPLVSRPSADATSIEDLVTWVHEGRIRIPGFQRPLRWRAQQVLELFDSLWLGYPVGNLLFWKRPADAAQLELGPLRIDAKGRADALWVVDGQQRLTALACVLLHPHPTTSSNDLFALWFDLESQQFIRPRSGQDISPYWLPMNRVLDAVTLGEWWGESPERAGRSDLYRVALQLGKRLRESRIPIYTVETDDPEAVRTIFLRLNTSGVSMRETEVFTALHSTDGLRSPLLVLRDVCQESRMGLLEDSWRLRCLRVVAGERLDQQTRLEIDAYRQWVTPAAMALGSALEALKTEGHVPHLRLLPYRLPVITLTRFFHLHPDPSVRTRELLRRWLWRGIVSGHHKNTQNPQLRWLSSAIDADESASAQRLLASCGQVDEAQVVAFAGRVSNADRSSHSAESRVYGCLLAHAGPRHVETGELLDVGQLFDELGPNALLKVADGRSDRVLHSYLDDPAIALDSATEEVRASHYWTRSSDGEGGRRLALGRIFADILLAWCAPGMPDLPSLADTFADLGEE